MRQITTVFLAATLVFFGMVGLSRGIEYSGWVLFIGLCAAYEAL